MCRDGNLPEPSAAVLREWFKYITEGDDTAVDLIGELYLPTDLCCVRVMVHNGTHLQLLF